MRFAAILQHAPFEGPGRIGPWLEQHDYRVEIVRPYAGDPFPAADAPDFVVVMGGPMSVNDTAVHPWLEPELSFVRASLERRTPLFGICLGAQIIAAASGARVYPHTRREIGWFPIEKVPAPAGLDVLPLPDRADVFHWHGETFDLPRDAVHLASSQTTPHQAFQIGRSTLAFQFHVETTPDLVEGLVTHCRDELVVSPSVQSADLLLDDLAERCAALTPLLETALAYLHTSR
jgi:GMP synthase-like glutamine amidotransferase